MNTDGWLVLEIDRRRVIGVERGDEPLGSA